MRVPCLARFIAPAILAAGVASASTAGADEPVKVEYDEGCPSYACGDTNLSLQRIAPTTTTASSTLAGPGYAPRNAADGKPATAWCEGAAGDGAGEWLRLDFGRAVAVKVITLAPWYAKSRTTLAANGRVKRLRIELEGFSREITLVDAKWCEGCQVEVPAPYLHLRRAVETTWLRLTILEVHPRHRADDTCISEVGVLAPRSSRRR